MEAKLENQKIASFENTGDDPFVWEDFCNDIGYLIKRSKKFYVTGSNMGWRHLSGFAVVNTNEPQAFMTSILPKTNDLSIDVFKSDKPGAICEMTIFHHDSPTGEFRTVYSFSRAKKLKLINE